MKIEQLTKQLEAEYEKEVGVPMSVFNMCMRPFRQFLIVKIRSLMTELTQLKSAHDKLEERIEVNETGWVIENGAGGGDLLQYRTMDDNGCISWTPDIDVALQFRRREDAERFAKEDEDAWGIVEHYWPVPELTPEEMEKS